MQIVTKFKINNLNFPNINHNSVNLSRIVADSSDVGEHGDCGDSNDAVSDKCGNGNGNGNDVSNKCTDSNGGGDDESDKCGDGNGNGNGNGNGVSNKCSDSNGGGDDASDKCGGKDDGDNERGDGDGECDEAVIDGCDGDVERSDGSCDFLLFFPSSLTTRSSPNMLSFKRFTSDNLTGFTIKSSAPSSKHLSIRAKTFSDDMITTGISLKVDDSLIFLSNS